MNFVVSSPKPFCMDHSNSPGDPINPPRQQQPSCSFEHFSAIISTLSKLYMPTNPFDEELHENVCKVISIQLSQTFHINHSFSNCSEFRKAHPCTSLQQRLQDHLQCLHQSASITFPAVEKTFTFLELAEYIESKNTLEALAKVLLQLLRSQY